MNNHLLMQKAIKEALKGEFKTTPNPMVGCIIIKNNKIIGKGYHKKSGSAHAEVEAITKAKKAGHELEGSTLIVTLEPCNHHGKTPPCVDLIIKSKISKVIIGTKDNSGNTKSSIEKMKKAGIEVEVGIEEEKAKELIADFLYYTKSNLPIITIKSGATLDGKVATKNYDSRGITNAESLKHANEIRKKVDAIMIGANTLRKDNSILKVKDLNNKKYKGKQPIPIIAINNLTEDLLNYKIFERPCKKYILSEKTQTKYIIEKYQEKNIEIIIKPLKEGLIELRKKGLNNILVEGGVTLLSNLFEENLITKIHYYLAGKVMANKEAINVYDGLNTKYIKDLTELTLMQTKVLKNDIFLNYIVKKGS